MARPITNSKEIGDFLESINAKLDNIQRALPGQPKQLTEEEKAVLVKMGLPVPENVPVEDPVLKGQEKLAFEFKAVKDFAVQHAADERQFDAHIASAVDSLTRTINGLFWALIIVLFLMVLTAVSSFDGCKAKTKTDNQVQAENFESYIVAQGKKMDVAIKKK